MRRAEVFLPLSHDHHHGLQMVARLRRGLRGEGDAAALAAEVATFWTEHLVPHFAEEEAVVIPLLQRGAPPLAARMRREHAALRAQVEAVEARRDAQAFAAFADALAAHIRFEEREAFPAAERLLRDGVTVPPNGDA